MMNFAKGNTEKEARPNANNKTFLYKEPPAESLHIMSASYIPAPCCLALCIWYVLLKNELLLSRIKTVTHCPKKDVERLYDKKPKSQISCHFRSVLGI